MSADAGEIVCNIVFRLSISCSVPEIFAIEVRSRPKSRQKHVFGPEFFFFGGGGGPPNFGPSFYPRDAMLARSLRQRRVRLSGRPSVTRRYCAKTVHFRHKVTMGR